MLLIAILLLCQKYTKLLHDVASLNLVDKEWRKHAIEESEMVKTNQSDPPFWRERINKKTLCGELKYTNLSKVTGCMMSLQCANAPVQNCSAL